MGDQEPPQFGSLEEELEYWKDQANRHQQICLLPRLSFWEGSSNSMHKAALSTKDRSDVAVTLDHAFAQLCQH
ncbi:hypothetical protein XENOCAPTIV_022927 [Xenoophorus captivus]|uniref:Uncharacterized protein n=1 Tax=Xenoophorus captivus TaxID=1517983 RepID=A0ABV0RBQ8_9TELE